MLLLYAIPVIMLVWVAVDACFHPAFVWACSDVGFLQEELPLWPASSDILVAKYHQWTTLGPRIAAFLVAGFLLVLSSVIAIQQGMVARVRIRMITALMFAATFLGVMTFQYENILWMSAQRRVAKRLPYFDAAVEPLIDEWPIESGVHPTLGEFFCSGDLPTTLYFRHAESYALSESAGISINRISGGGVQFSLEPHYRYVLEYHPSQQKPAVQRQTRFWIEILWRSAQLADGWYLTEYELVRK